MALQGVNLPLAFSGQEAIWQKVFKVKRYLLVYAFMDEDFHEINDLFV